MGIFIIISMIGISTLIYAYMLRKRILETLLGRSINFTDILEKYGAVFWLEENVIELLKKSNIVSGTFKRKY